MHWFDGLPKLIAHRLGAPPATSYVSGNASAQSQLHRGILEDSEIEQLANSRAAEKPQTLNYHDRFRPDRFRARKPAMCWEVVTGDLRLAPTRQGFEHAFESRPVYCLRIVKIDAISLGQ